MGSTAGFSIDPVNASSQISVAVTSMLTLIAYRFAVDTQLPRLPYMTRLDALFLTSTLLVFFSLVEVMATTILHNNQQTERAKKLVFIAASFSRRFSQQRPLQSFCIRADDSMKARQFFAELKRRQFYRVAVVYAIVAWLLIQIASISFPAFQAPRG